VRQLLILALAALAMAVPLAAQDTSTEYFRGFNSYNPFDFGSFDSVNEDNGNLMVDIPIISYPQRGTLPDFRFIVQNTGWSWYMTCSIVNNVQRCQWMPGNTGARYKGAYLAVDPHLVVGTRYCGYNVCGSVCTHGCKNYYVIDASGGIHNLGNLPGSTYSESIDGSGFKYYPLNGVTDRSGTFVAYRNDIIRDTAGNTITYNSTTGTWTDSVGRSIPDNILLSNSQGLLAGCTTKNFPVVNGGTAPVTICASNISYASQFVPDGFNATNNSGTLAMITSITLPNNTSWTFSYNSWGDLSQITTPTGGSISYTWKNVSMASGAQEAFYRGIATRTANANDGTGNKVWTYSANLNGTIYPGVTDPDGDMTVITSNYCGVSGGNQCAPMNTRFYTPSGVLLKTLDTQYTSIEDPLDFYDPIPSNQYILPTRTTTTWPSGLVNQTTLTYDPGGTFKDPNCSACSSYPFPYGSIVQKQEYDYASGAPGPLLRQTNTQFQWQNSSTFLTANLLSQPATITVYDSANNHCKGQASPCAQTNYAYDETGNGSVCTTLPCGNLTSVTRWLNGGTSPKTQYVYNSNGMRTKMCDPIDVTCLNPTRYTYDSTGLFLSQIQYPDTVTNGVTYHHIENFSYDLNTGLLNWHKDQNVQQMSYGYDSMRRIKSVSYPDGGSETYCYMDKPADSCPPTTVVPSFVFTKAINSGTNFVETGVVDGFGRSKQSKTTVPASTCSSGFSYVDTTYDNEGRKFSVSNPYCTTSDSTYGLTKTYYDALNRVTSVVEQDWSTVSTDFSVFPCITVTDEAGKKRKSCSDGSGRLTRVWEDPGSSPHLNYETDYTYDALDNLLSVTQSGSRQRTFTYDSLSRLTIATNPESGTICYGTYSGSTCQQNGYDANGNLTARREARNIGTTYGYDALNRLTSKTYSDSTPAVTLAYDVATLDGLSFQNPVGRLVKTTGGNANKWQSYDPMGRVATFWQCMADVCATGNVRADNVYNLAGGLTSYTGTGVTFTQTIDSANRVTQVTSNFIDPQHPGTLVTVDPSIGFYPNGAIRKLTLGNGLTEATVYSPRFQPCRIDVNSSGTLLSQCSGTPPTGNLLDLSFNWNPGFDNGNLAGASAVGQRTFNRTYGYDNVNRLTSMSSPADPSGCSGLSWTYDQWGNRTDQTVTGGACGTSHVSVNPLNQLVGPPYQYDAAGNLTFDGSHSYTYDAENRITQVDGGATATYVYDANGQRVRKLAGGVTIDYAYDSEGKVSGEIWTPPGYFTVGYIYLNGQLVAEYKDSTTYFVHKDHLGSTRLLTRLDQTVCDSMDYLPFGEQIAGGTCTSHKFTGKERDGTILTETGLDYFGARYYSSQYGRFMGVDPLWVKADRILDPQRLNLYAYARNNPPKLTDPTGMDVNLGRCASDMTTTMCEAAVRNGLQKQDRSHVQFVEGNGKNGYKKGEVGVLVDSNYKSKSLNFTTLQSLANDHTALARIDILNPSDTYSFRADVSYPPKGLSTLSSTAADFGGYTFFQFRGKEEPGIMYSIGDFTNVVVSTDPALDLSQSIYHELQHVFLGDFGRSALKGTHLNQDVNDRTKAAEKEALENEKNK
jgi:RHS repeat-associated protein